MKKGTKMPKEVVLRAVATRMKNGSYVAWNKGKPATWAMGKKNINWKGGRTGAAMKADYAKKHPDKIRKWKKQYHEAHKNEPNYKLTIILRKTILKKVGSKTKKARGSSVRYLGCTIGELRTYLEGKFQDGMNWENHGTHGWHIDHVVPISFFNLDSEEQRIQAFNYRNLQPLWAVDNLKKYNKTDYVKAG